MEHRDTESADLPALVLGMLAGDLDVHDPRMERAPMDVFVRAVDAAREPARVRAAGIGWGADVVDRTFEDIDRKIDAYGDQGIRSWILMLLRLDVVQLGRLQFEPMAGPLGHAVHIPELGPLTPELVDDAFALARDALGSDRFSCESWMLDPAVEDLPEHSNIRRFRDRFRIEDGRHEGGHEDGHAADGPPTDGRPDGQTGSGHTEGDASVCKFVFRRPVDEVLMLSDTDVRTSVERLVLQRLRTGYHWREVLGTITPE